MEKEWKDSGQSGIFLRRQLEAVFQIKQKDRAKLESREVLGDISGNLSRRFLWATIGVRDGKVYERGVVGA